MCLDPSWRKRPLLGTGLTTSSALCCLRSEKQVVLSNNYLMA